MYAAISTTAFVSILALASSLAVVVQAGDPRPLCLEKDPISTHITCNALRTKLGGMEIAQILVMNPDKKSCEEIIASGWVCTGVKFLTCIKKVGAGPTDTCDGLAAANGISKDMFIDYNDDVEARDCSGLVLGHKYCVSVEG